MEALCRVKAGSPPEKGGDHEPFYDTCAYPDRVDFRLAVYLLTQARSPSDDPTEIALTKSYQLAFFTPGINPAEAISRNWIRLIPN